MARFDLGQPTHGGQGPVVSDPGVGHIRVAAFGDSLMWGQGVDRADRFSLRFTNMLAGQVGKPGALMFDASRSGTKIRDLPGERDDFADIYPFLFVDAKTRREFVEGDTDAPARGLYGEIPATFPTVLGQVKMLPEAAGKKIDIALVTRGINDISPENVVNPLLYTGRYIERYDGEIRQHNLRSHRPLAADVTHLDVDSLALIIRTARNSSRNLGMSAGVVLTLIDHAGGGTKVRTFRLTFINYVNVFEMKLQDGDPIVKPYPYLEPGMTNRLTVVTTSDIPVKLEDIVGCALVLGPDPWPKETADIRRRYGRSWSPESVTLEVNGVRVKTVELFGQSFGPGANIDLGWPAANPGFKLPVMRTPKIKRVRKLAKLETNPRLPGRRAL